MAQAGSGITPDLWASRMIWTTSAGSSATRSNCGSAAEILLLAILDVAILHQRGLGELTAQPFRPSVVFAPGFGIAAIYAFNGLIGVEGTAIYQEEARDRTRTVPRATYLSVIAIGSFYVLTSWCLVVGVGPGQFLVEPRFLRREVDDAFQRQGRDLAAHQ